MLGSIEKLIENNNKLNENLLQQAQALFADAFPYEPDDELPGGWKKGTALASRVETTRFKVDPFRGTTR